MANISGNLKVSESPRELLSGHKFSQRQQKIVLSILEETPNISSTQIIQNMQDINDPLLITYRHLNRVRYLWGLNRDRGRPEGKQESELFKKKN